MKAMVLEEFNKPLQLRDVEIPKSGPDDVLIKMKVCSICGTDLKIYSGKIDTVSLPLIPGHEIAGQIVKTGENVKELKKGDDVTVPIYITCGRCKNCRSGRTTVCLEDIKRLGFEINGGFAEYMSAPAENAVKIRKNISYAEAALIPDAISTAVHAFSDRIQIIEGDMVLVLGAGGLGIHGLQVAKAFGATVVVADIDERKLELAEELGADYTFNSRTKDLVKECKELTGGHGVDVVAEFVGISQTCELGLKCLRRAGTMVMMGYAPGTTFNVPSMDIAMGEKEIIGSRAMTKQNVIDCLKLVSEGKVKPQIDQIFALGEANEALDKLANEGFLGRGILVIDE